jgi:hypothetical protein
MRSTLVLSLVLVALACGAPGPAATVKDMLALAEAGDWGAYVDDYYGEQHKFDSPADRDALVNRFRDQWGARVLPALKAASETEPRIEGNKAIFEKDGKTVFVLHRSPDGKWTFHL